MTAANDNSKASCGGPCLRCTYAPAKAGEIAGWRMVLSAAGVFLGPIVPAIAAAVVFRGSGAGQFFGGLGGLCFGVAVVVVVARAIHRPISSKEAS